jgi:hypothetical protein
MPLLSLAELTFSSNFLVIAVVTKNWSRVALRIGWVGCSFSRNARLLSFGPLTPRYYLPIRSVVLGLGYKCAVMNVWYEMLCCNVWQAETCES